MIQVCLLATLKKKSSKYHLGNNWCCRKGLVSLLFLTHRRPAVYIFAQDLRGFPPDRTRPLPDKPLFFHPSAAFASSTWVQHESYRDETHCPWRRRELDFLFAAICHRPLREINSRLHTNRYSLNPDLIYREFPAISPFSSPIPDPLTYFLPTFTLPLLSFSAIILSVCETAIFQRVVRVGDTEGNDAVDGHDGSEGAVRAVVFSGPCGKMRAA